MQSRRRTVAGSAPDHDREPIVVESHPKENTRPITRLLGRAPKGEKYLSEDGTPRPRLAERERLLAELARETDADIELGEEIREGCEELADRIPSDWEERALSEVTTAGYQPVHKHGVRINITPLAEADLVPELVERKVL